MAVVLDLDETLLVANSASTLDSKIEATRKTRRLKAAELQDLLSSGVTADSEEAARLRGAELAASKEEELLSADLDLLRQFASTNTITYNGVAYKARSEVAYLDDGTAVKRPVIRVDKPQPLIFTRIRPEQRETSMILRPRPFWEELRGVLAGDAEAGPDGRPKLRFDVYVCTAAERQYALEVWRLLDTAAKIIPVEQRSRRIVNVSGSRKKQLLRSLGVAEAAGNPRLDWFDLPDDEPPIPLAVVLDDRLDVWEAASQPAILQVVPWYWYRDEGARLVSGPGTPADRLALASENEIKRMRDAVLMMRAELFYDINERLRLLAERLVTAGAPEADQQRDPGALLPGLKTVAGVLRSGGNRVYQMPTLASIAAQYRLNSATPPPELEAPPLGAPPPPQSLVPPGPQGFQFPPAAGPAGGPPAAAPLLLPLGPTAPGLGRLFPSGAEGGAVPNGAGPSTATGVSGQPPQAPPPQQQQQAISLKPVDPRAVRRAAAGQRAAAGASTPRPPTGAVLQPPPGAPAPQGFTGPGPQQQVLPPFGGPQLAGPPPVAAAEPPRRRAMAAPLDPSKSGQGADRPSARSGGGAAPMEVEKPAAKPELEVAQAPPGEESVAGERSAAPSKQEPAVPDVKVEGAREAKQKAGEDIKREGSAPGTSDGAKAEQPGSAAAGPGPAERAGPGAAPGAVPAPAAPQQSSGGEAPAPVRSAAAPPPNAALVSTLINHISALDPGLRSQIEQMIGEGKMAEVMRLLKQQQQRAKSVEPPAPQGRQAAEQPQQQQLQQQAPQQQQQPLLHHHLAPNGPQGPQQQQQQQQQYPTPPGAPPPQLQQHLQGLGQPHSAPPPPHHAPPGRTPTPPPFGGQPPGTQGGQGLQGLSAPPGLPGPPPQGLGGPPHQHQPGMGAVQGQVVMAPDGRVVFQPVPLQGHQPPGPGQGFGPGPGPGPGPAGQHQQLGGPSGHPMAPPWQQQQQQQQGPGPMAGQHGPPHMGPGPGGHEPPQHMQQHMQQQGPAPGQMGPGGGPGQAFMPPLHHHMLQQGPSPGQGMPHQQQGMMLQPPPPQQQFSPQHPPQQQQPSQQQMRFVALPGGGIASAQEQQQGPGPGLGPGQGGPGSGPDVMMQQMLPGDMQMVTIIGFPNGPGPGGMAGMMGPGPGPQGPGPQPMGMGGMGPGQPPMQQQMGGMSMGGVMGGGMQPGGGGGMQPGGGGGMPTGMMMPQGPGGPMGMLGPQQGQIQQQQMGGGPGGPMPHMGMAQGMGVPPHQQQQMMGQPMGMPGSQMPGGQMPGGQMLMGMQPQQPHMGMPPNQLQHQQQMGQAGGPGGPPRAPLFMAGQGQPGQQGPSVLPGAPGGGPAAQGTKRPPSPGRSQEPPSKAARQGENGPSGLPGGPPPWQQHPQQQAQGQQHQPQGQAPPPGPPPGPPEAGDQQAVGAGRGADLVAIENPVTKLNELAQRNRATLGFREQRNDGGGGGWTMVVTYNAKDVGRGHAGTKKEAKRLAAMAALKHLGVSLATGPAPSSGAPGRDQPEAQGAGRPGARFIGPVPPPGGVAAVQEGGATGQPESVDAQGSGVPEESPYPRLFSLHEKSHCTFNITQDSADPPRLRAELSIQGVAHRAVGHGATARAARMDAARRMLALLDGCEPAPEGGDAPQRAPYHTHHQGSSGGGGGQGGSSHDSDSDGGGGGGGSGGRRRKGHHHHDHHHGRASHSHRAASRSPARDDEGDDAGDDDYGVLAASAYGVLRGNRPGVQSHKRAAGQEAAAKYDFMQLIAEELDEGLGGPGPGTGGAGAGTGASHGRGGAGGGRAQGQAAQSHAAGEDSEEEEGELPSDEEGS
ncbi:hypothetical protein GPECTOR_61g844 [Gonium pectorale]|uniref:protein-serine/threonine phosphatase n=1 Tax=Gonium pectorale TaxID=33097 RepID=A0A150G4Z2_GONPE|nr:hypothetical protein GPECTOR_61g844 [Gonium pectorale]|eukprot:KXZ44891.1 hypothetical protein GPECTOR_61g844 [Gonium pectorale]